MRLNLNLTKILNNFKIKQMRTINLSQNLIAIIKFLLKHSIKKIIIALKLNKNILVLLYIINEIKTLLQSKYNKQIIKNI